MPVVRTCAWHEADAVVLAGRLEVKSPAVAGRKGNANKARAGSRNGPSGACLLQAGKHEAEPVYVANSEPTIWQRGGGRAGVGERDLISGEPNPCLTAGREVKLDGIWGGVASYPGKPSWPGVESCERRQKTDPDKEIPKRVGAKGWQIHG